MTWAKTPQSGIEARTGFGSGFMYHRTWNSTCHRELSLHLESTLKCHHFHGDGNLTQQNAFCACALMRKPRQLCVR
jgi:hypothetical protein